MRRRNRVGVEEVLGVKLYISVQLSSNSMCIGIKPKIFEILK